MVQCATCGEQTLVPMEDIFDAAPIESFPTASRPPNPPIAPNQVESPPSEAFEPPRETGASYALSHYEIESSEPDEAISELDVSDRDEAGELDDLPDNEWSEDDIAAYAKADEMEVEAPPLTLSRRKRIDDDMDLTPMVDVTFQLLIFFMVTASFAMQKSIQVPTPDPDQKGATQQMQTLDDLQGTSILVKIDGANSILIDDEPLSDPSQLTEVLRDKMRKEQKTELLITAHTAALHRGVIAVIDAANEVGMQKIRLASRKGKDD